MAAWADTLPRGEPTWDIEAYGCRIVVSPVLGLVEEQFAAGFLGQSFTAAHSGHMPLYDGIHRQECSSRTSSSSLTASTAGLSRGITRSSSSSSSSGDRDCSLVLSPVLGSTEDMQLVEAAGQAPPLALTRSYSSPELTAYTTAVALHQGLYLLQQHGSRRSLEDDPEVAAWRHLTMQDMLPHEYASSCSSSSHNMSWGRSLAPGSSTCGSSSLAGSSTGAPYGCEYSSGDDSVDSSSAGHHSFRRMHATPSRLGGAASSGAAKAWAPDGTALDDDSCQPGPAALYAPSAAATGPFACQQVSSLAPGKEAAAGAGVPSASACMAGGPTGMAPVAAPRPGSKGGMMSRLRVLKGAAVDFGDELGLSAAGVCDACVTAASRAAQFLRCGRASGKRLGRGVQTGTRHD